MQNMIKNYFQLNGLTTKILDVDVQGVMKQNGIPFHKAYDIVSAICRKRIRKK